MKVEGDMDSDSVSELSGLALIQHYAFILDQLSECLEELLTTMDDVLIRLPRQGSSSSRLDQDLSVSGGNPIPFAAERLDRISPFLKTVAQPRLLQIPVVPTPPSVSWGTQAGREKRSKRSLRPEPGRGCNTKLTVTLMSDSS
ncbi:hypothetical protein ColTof4_14011 [Colletotrichum tofieldiae]|nr:hypothetical protein ColTof4_14011 [Colletotrichum tofieldiae]GKT97565.1 hypothetical protein Ct61P_15415 [Colletotrichum tofieldiae]